MFTGIVEHVGTVDEYNEFDPSVSGGNGVSVTIKNAAQVLSDCHIGDSIACNGICLTVTEFNDDSFKVGIAPETISRTEVSSWKAGTKINLERAVKEDVRFGGHFVQGHVDTVATIVSKTADSNSVVYTFRLRDVELASLIVEKGYVAIDGVSLTVTRVEDDGIFCIAMIAHTQEHVAIPLKPIGALVNVEADITGKIIAKQVQAHLTSQLAASDSALTKLVEKIVDSKLKKLEKD